MILAVVSGKGGVGKSTLAFNLAAALDAAADGGSVVVDADLGMADLPRGRGPDLHDVLAGRADPLEAIREGPVRVLPCGRTLAGARAADLRAMDDALTAVDADADHVVVDCPCGLRADVGVPLAVADMCLIVVSPQRFALADAVRTRELARELGAGLAGVVVNRAVDDPPADVFGRVLGAPATVVPADPRVGRSVAEGTPVGSVAPDSDAARAIASLAADVRACDRD